MPSHGEQVFHGDFELRHQLLLQDFTAGENAVQLEAELEAVIDFHIVVARIHQPQARHADFLVEFLFHHRVGVMIVAADDFDGEKEFAAGGGHEREVGAKRRGAGDLNLRARREELRAGEAVDADGEFAMEPGADLFVADAGRGTRQRRAVQDFLVRPAHRMSFKLKGKSFKRGINPKRRKPCGII